LQFTCSPGAAEDVEDFVGHRDACEIPESKQKQLIDQMAAISFENNMCLAACATKRKAKLKIGERLNERKN
jgi:hypothetical protein